MLRRALLPLVLAGSLSGTHRFDPSAPEALGNDSVLVLDSADAALPAPGVEAR